MDTAETRRLVQQIESTLRDPRRQFQEPKLAREYTEACRAVNLRLEQSVSLIRGGQIVAGLHLAEAAPAVLDLIAVLGFREERKWRTRCESKGNPAPEPFNDDPVRELNAEFQRDIDATHPLYRDYRQAILKGNEGRALAVLRLIERLRPNDAQAATEGARLEKKFTRSRLERLEQAVDDADERSVGQILAGLERLEFSPGDDMDLWRRAQAVRIRARLAQLDELRENDHWIDARKLLERLETIRSRFQIDLEEKEIQRLRAANEWTEQRAAETEEDRNYKKAFGELQNLLNVCEEKYLAVRRRPVAELRMDFEGLAKKWQELQRYERAVPEEFEEKFDKYFRLVRYQVRQRERMNKLAFVTGALTVLAVTVIAVTMFRANRRGNQLAAELDRYGRERQPIAAEMFITQIVSNDTRLIALPRLTAALNKAGSFIEREDKIHRRATEKALWLLAQGEAGFVDLSPEQYIQHYEEAEQLKRATAEDFAHDVEKRLSDYRNQWDAWLFGEREARSERFARELDASEKIAGETLELEKGEEKIREGLKQIESNLPILQALANPKLEDLKVKTELEFRFQALNQKFKNFKNKVDNWEGIQKNLADPESLQNFVSTLREFISNDFAPIENVRRARELTTVAPSISDMVLHLLAYGDDRIRVAIDSRTPLPEHPGQMSTAERGAISVLGDDAIINGLTRYEVVELKLSSTDPNRQRLIYIRGSMEKNKFGRLEGEAFDPARSPDAIRYEKRQFATGDFELKELGKSPEFQLFLDTGLKTLSSGTESSYSVGMLELLDKLHGDKTTSPVFRGFLLVKLLELSEVRPTMWSLQWAPALKPLRKRLRELEAMEIRSGDWIIPDRIRKFTSPMQTYFAEAEKVQLKRQSEFLHRLASRAGGDGFKFVGYVEPEAKVPTAVTDTAQNLGELWGWSGETKRPALLFRYNVETEDYQTLKPPMPFSPLFVFPSDREKMIRSVAGSINFDLASATNRAYLPKLFLE